MANYLEGIQKTLEKPLKIIFQEKGNLTRHYSYQKDRKNPEKYKAKYYIYSRYT